MSQAYGRSLDTPLSSTQYQDTWAPGIPDQSLPGLVKRLKDRKSRFLTSADTIHYSHIATALVETEALQASIDMCLGHVLLVSSIGAP